MALCLCGASYIYCFHLPFYRFQKVRNSAKTWVWSEFGKTGGKLPAGKPSCTSGGEGSNMWMGKLHQTETWEVGGMQWLAAGPLMTSCRGLLVVQNVGWLSRVESVMCKRSSLPCEYVYMSDWTGHKGTQQTPRACRAKAAICGATFNSQSHMNLWRKLQSVH